MHNYMERRVEIFHQTFECYGSFHNERMEQG